MSLIIPYTFKGGTSAKAQEVNANFVAVQKAFDSISSNQDNLQNMYESLNVNKANTNGSTGQVFNVAEPVSGYHAVNRDYFWNNINWLQYIISGLHMQIIDGDTFTITPGGCFDSTGNYVIYNNTNYTTGNLQGLGVSATYNVYIKARSGDTTPTIYGLQFKPVNGSQDITLDYEDTIYRKIGTITTNASKELISTTKEEY